MGVTTGTAVSQSAPFTLLGWRVVL
jgi:hypothetical protein